MSFLVRFCDICLNLSLAVTVWNEQEMNDYPIRWKRKLRLIDGLVQ